MTDLRQASPRRTALRPTQPGWRVVLLLARVEGRLLLRRPLFPSSIALAVGLLLFLTWSEAPVMHRDDILVAGTLLPVAGAVYLQANLAGSRSRRRGTEDLLDASPTSALSRTTAHLLSLGWPVAVAIALTAAEVAYLKASGGVWAPSPAELATGPMIVLLAGACGVLVSRFAPWIVAGPVGLVALAALQFAFMSADQYSRPLRRWGAFWLNHDQFIPRELAYRPAGWHLIYVAGLAVLAIAATRLRHGPSPGRITAVVAAVALVATGLEAQSRPENLPRQLAADKIREPVVCETHDGVRYCAYRAYAPWIERWRSVVSAVYAAAPAEPRSGLTVVQSIESLYEGDSSTLEADPPGLVRTNTLWGRRFNAGIAAMSLAKQAAAWVVGLPAGNHPVSVVWTEESIRGYIEAEGGRLPPEHEPLTPGTQRYRGPCHTVGQARAIVGLWLAARSSPGAANFLRAMLASQPYGIRRIEVGGFVVDSGPGVSAPPLALSHSTAGLYAWPYAGEYGGTLEWGLAEAHYAARLLDRPATEVRRILQANWATLTSPSTRTEDALPVLDLRALPSIEDQIRKLGFTPEEAIRSAYAWAEPAKIEAMIALGTGSLVPRAAGAPCP